MLAADFEPRSAWNRALAIALASASPVVYAIVALIIGKKTGWDLFNYHWYNAYAWLHDRFHVDVAVAHHATYYNPLSDLPLYWLTTHGPAWWGGAFMGAMAGLAVALIGFIAHGALPGKPSVPRTALIAFVAILSTTGAGAFQEIGDPANDIPAAIGLLAAIAVIIFWLGRSATERENSVWRVPVVAGVLAGISVALKLTTAVYAIGIAGALLFASGSPRIRIATAVSCGTGMAIGLLFVGGPWMYQLWRFSGNPLFPYFNDVFHSSLLLTENYRDLNFRPNSWFSALTFPWQLTLDSRTVSESVFRDARILILYVLLPITFVVRWLLKASPARTPLPDTARFLFAFAAVAYVAWLGVFGIYRYLIPLEMLAPLLVAIALVSWPVRVPLQYLTAACILFFAQWLVKVDLSDRQTWNGPYVEVSAPDIPLPNDTLILMTGHAPMAFVIPAFPSQIPFVRIDSWLIGASDTTSGLALAMRERVARHAGPLFVLFEDEETELATLAAKHYGLNLPVTSETCEAVKSNINAPLWLCEATRIRNAQSLLSLAR